MMLLKNDQMQFSEKHGKFRDGEKPYYFVVKMNVPNHFYLEKCWKLDPSQLSKWMNPMQGLQLFFV